MTRNKEPVWGAWHVMLPMGKSQNEICVASVRELRKIYLFPSPPQRCVGLENLFSQYTQEESTYDSLRSPWHRPSSLCQLALKQSMYLRSQEHSTKTCIIQPGGFTGSYWSIVSCCCIITLESMDWLELLIEHHEPVIILGLSLGLYGYDNNFAAPLMQLPLFIEKYQGLGLTFTV